MKIHLPKIIKTGPLVKVADGHYEQEVVYEMTDEMAWYAFIYWLKMGVKK